MWAPLTSIPGSGPYTIGGPTTLYRFPVLELARGRGGSASGTATLSSSVVLVPERVRRVMNLGGASTFSIRLAIISKILRSDCRCHSYGTTRFPFAWSPSSWNPWPCNPRWCVPLFPVPAGRVDSWCPKLYPVSQCWSSPMLGLSRQMIFRLSPKLAGCIHSCGVNATLSFENLKSLPNLTLSYSTGEIYTNLK